MSINPNINLKENAIAGVIEAPNGWKLNEVKRLQCHMRCLEIIQLDSRTLIHFAQSSG